jgi:hypothetical protein
MRWLSFLLVASTAAAARAQAPRAAKPLRFDFTLAPELRDSFVFHVRGEERGWAVWQYEIHSDETGQQVLYTAASELRPVEAESLRIVVNRITGAPVATFHRLDFFSPGTDTVQLEHDLDVRRGEVTGRRRARTRKGEVRLTPVSTSLPAGVVWSDYQFFAAPLALALPGDSLVGLGYSEFADSLQALVLVAETPTTVIVPAGSFDVLPLRAGGFRLYVTRTEPRRVVKGETLDGVFTFELAGTGRPFRPGS